MENKCEYIDRTVVDSWWLMVIPARSIIPKYLVLLYIYKGPGFTLKTRKERLTFRWIWGRSVRTGDGWSGSGFYSMNGFSISSYCSVCYFARTLCASEPVVGETFQRRKQSDDRAEVAKSKWQVLHFGDSAVPGRCGPRSLPARWTGCSAVYSCHPAGRS